MNNIFDALVEARSATVLDPGFVVVKRSGRNGSAQWISGVPYLWTTFIERACVFPSRAEAARFIMRFDLLECSVVPA